MFLQKTLKPLSGKRRDAELTSSSWAGAATGLSGGCSLGACLGVWFAEHPAPFSSLSAHYGTSGWKVDRVITTGAPLRDLLATVAKKRTDRVASARKE